MRPQKVQDEEIITSLVKSFRSHGYEGSSLAELAKSTGLKKASLYHRFPKGKHEMAVAVLDYIEEWVDEHILKLLMDDAKPPVDRLIKVLDEIRISYDKGNETCIFRALSLGQSLSLFDAQIKKGMNTWIIAFKTLGLSFGFDEDEAQKKAMNTLIKIQGSLIVTKGLDDLKVFENTLNDIKSDYLKT
ncbi:TetR/AcrR family transcriptional regulator [Flavivirga aquimarina]|uniref:TetR/AcrR family transcriptional regulator n=1 Tax=Flavivirga aquimarina TaxID=2027862 RepID=A0ABT8WED5_9FLAO|nr:TetR/AcrR family transcriptional regulator [Flavivirga aquimarina]MDO5971408.1 TetR/AcrR family transcriptional regulator [Flavivirga aquimarina]